MRQILICLLLMCAATADAQVKISALPAYPGSLSSTVRIPSSDLSLSTTQSYYITTPQIQSFMEAAPMTWTAQQNFSSSVECGSPTGGALGVGTINCSTGYYVNGVIVPTYPQTAAEIAAGVTPVNYGYPVGNVLRYETNTNPGTTDMEPAFADAVAVSEDPYAPPELYRLGSALVIKQGVVLRSDGMSGSNPGIGATLQCDLSVTPCVTIGGASATDSGGGLVGFNVTRSSGTIPPGSIGVLVENVYNPTLSYVSSTREAIGFEFLSDGISNGISAQVDHLYTGAISDAHVVQNTWPELRITQSRFGMNGGGDLSTCTAYIRETGGSTVNSASGPNTLYVANTQFNQGGGATCSHWLEFVNRTSGAISDNAEWSFVNDHVESVSSADIYSDATWALIDRVKIANVQFNDVGTPFLLLNSSTTLGNWLVANSQFGGGMTIAPSSQFNAVDFSNDEFQNAVSVTGVSNSAFGSSNDIFENGLSYAGSFGSLRSIGDDVTSGSFSFSATGTNSNSINFDGSSFASGTWIPLITFGGGSTGQTYTRQAGSYQITGNRVCGDYSLIFSSIGTSTGDALLTGLPFAIKNTNAAGGGGGTITYFTPSNLTGTPIAEGSVGTATMNLYQFGSSGMAVVTNSDFQGTSALFGTFCYEWE